MTHDVLLAKIDIWKFQTKGYDDTYEVHGILNALRAVVELHQPDANKNCVSCFSESYFGGRIFTNGKYPCPTIQAIEKELG